MNAMKMREIEGRLKASGVTANANEGDELKYALRESYRER